MIQIPSVGDKSVLDELTGGGSPPPPASEASQDAAEARTGGGEGGGKGEAARDAQGGSADSKDRGKRGGRGSRGGNKPSGGRSEQREGAQQSGQQAGQQPAPPAAAPAADLEWLPPEPTDVAPPQERIPPHLYRSATSSGGAYRKARQLASDRWREFARDIQRMRAEGVSEEAIERFCAQVGVTAPVPPPR